MLSLVSEHRKLFYRFRMDALIEYLDPLSKNSNLTDCSLLAKFSQTNKYFLDRIGIYCQLKLEKIAPKHLHQFQVRISNVSKLVASVYWLFIYSKIQRYLKEGEPFMNPYFSCIFLKLDSASPYFQHDKKNSLRGTCTKSLK